MSRDPLAVTSSRPHVVSSFTLIKGTLVEDTYRLFAQWQLSEDAAANFARARADNPIGARTHTWLRDVLKVVHRRFDPDGRDRPLVVLAQHGCPLDIWRPVLLWHMTRDEFLLRDFLASWLYPAFAAGTLRVRKDDVLPFLASVEARGGAREHAWSLTTTQRVANALLRAAADFGLLHGTVRREFAGYHLPDAAFLYLLHAVAATTPNAQRLIEAPDWRLFLMHPGDVEREILRLHQFRRLHYEAAGTLGQLTLPAADPLTFAEHLEVAA